MKMKRLLPAKRIRELPVHFFTDYVDRLAALKKAGADVIHLDVGSPDLPPPENVMTVLSEAASRIDSHGYQSHRWTSKYRLGWAAMYQKFFGVELDPDKDLLPLIGSKEGIFHLMLALIDPGDVVILPDPGYVTYLRGVQIAGGMPYFVKLLPEHGFLPDLSSIPARVSNKAKLLWINYPNNPTSATVESNFFRDVLDYAQKFDILICHDAAYTQINYGNYNSPSLLAQVNDRENVLEFNTLSKSHNMAGWRMGVAAGNQAAIKALLTIKSNADSGHFLPMIEAATVAMETPQSWITARNQIYQERRDLVYSTLHNLGFAPQLPRAGLYIWWQLPAGTDELEFSTRLLNEIHVSLTPGSAFGSEGKGFVRISLTQPKPRIYEALSRITNWIANGN